MANTPFLDQVKPAGTDKALVSVINSNSDKIDTGVSTLSDQIGSMKGKVDLGDLATTAAIESALDTKLSSLGNYERMVVQFRYTGTTDIFRNTFRYSCTLIRGSSVNYSFAECVCDSGAFSTIIGARGSSGWNWDGYASSNNLGALKFASLGSYNAATHEINIPSGSRHFVIQISSAGSNSGYAAMILATNNGTLVASDFFKGTNVTVSRTTNKVTFTYDSATTAYFYDFVLSGDAASRITT